VEREQARITTNKEGIDRQVEKDLMIGTTGDDLLAETAGKEETGGTGPRVVIVIETENGTGETDLEAGTAGTETIGVLEGFAKVTNLETTAIVEIGTGEMSEIAETTENATVTEGMTGVTKEEMTEGTTGERIEGMIEEMKEEMKEGTTEGEMTEGTKEEMREGATEVTTLIAMMTEERT
jgi:hypothetical protein